MRKMKDSGIQWIGDIPENWDAVKLSYLFGIIGSGTTPTSTNSDYYDGEYNWLQTGDLNDKEITTTSKTITQKAVDDYSTLTLYNKGTIVMAMYGATIGKLGILNIDSYTNQACCAMSRPDNIQPKFVYYWLMCNKENIVNLSIGGGQPNISQGIISTLKITIPKEITKQNEIVKYLDKKCARIDALIKAKEKANELLKEQRQSIIYETVTKGLDPDIPMKDSGIEWIGKIPESWNTTRVKYTSILKGRIGWQGLKSDEYINEGPYLITGVDFAGGRIDWDNCSHISKERYDEAPEIHIFEGDLLITKDGTIGKLAIAENCPKNVSLNSGVLLIRNKENGDYLNRYLYYVLQSDVFWKWFRLSQNGNSTIIHLYQEQFSNFRYSLPAIEEQKNIISHLDNSCTNIDKLISTHNTTIEKLKEYRKSVIFEAVTGKVEV